MSTSPLPIADIELMDVAWQLSLAHGDNEFDDTVIKTELQRHGVTPLNDKLLMRRIIRMLDLDLLEVREIGSLYRCAWTCSSSSKIELTIVPYNEELHRAVLRDVMAAVDGFGDLVDVAGDCNV